MSKIEIYVGDPMPDAVLADQLREQILKPSGMRYRFQIMPMPRRYLAADQEDARELEDRIRRAKEYFYEADTMREVIEIWGAILKADNVLSAMAIR